MLQKILEFFQSEDFQRFLIAALFGGTLGVYFTFRSAKKIFINSKSNYEKFFRDLDKKFANGLINNLEDVEVLVTAHFFSYTINFAFLLELYLKHILDCPDAQEGNHLKLKHDRVMGFLARLREEKPFAQAPSEEQRLLVTLNNALKEDNRQQAVESLKELGAVLTLRNKTYKRTDAINRAAVPLAIVGMALTVIFGLVK